MKLEDIFDSLASAELSTLNIVEDGYIKYESRGKVIRAINRAIIALGTRFLIKKKFVKLIPNEELFVYVLDEQHLFKYNEDIYAYLEDSNMFPFYNDSYVELLEIKDSQGRIIPLDGTGDIIRTSPNTICFKPNSQKDLFYTLEYKAIPDLANEMIESRAFYWDDLDINLAYLNAIVYFVAATLHSPTLSSLDGTRSNLDTNYRQLYEAECALLLSQGTDVDEYKASDLFSGRGFI